ncbi:MAG: hypothetical protein EBZ50_05725 [Alphaproteobacteria bacterium]|nr:hypothetical protein [Alphaproteobacteria bacterium]
MEDAMPISIASQMMIAEDRRIDDADATDLAIAIAKVYAAVDTFKAAILAAAAPTRAIEHEIADEFAALADLEADVVGKLRRYYDWQVVERAEDLLPTRQDAPR